MRSWYEGAGDGRPSQEEAHAMLNELDALRQRVGVLEGFLDNLVANSPSPEWLREQGYGDFPGILEKVRAALKGE